MTIKHVSTREKPSKYAWGGAVGEATPAGSTLKSRLPNKIAPQ